MYSILIFIFFIQLFQISLSNDNNNYDNYFKVADAECLKYSKNNDDDDDAYVSFVPAIKHRIGIIEKQCSLSGTTLIIGGTRADVGEFPHQAEIGFPVNSDEDITWACGGSLISENFVLTAAHCVQSIIGNPKFVRFGVVETQSASARKNIHKITQQIVHPNYDPNNSAQYDDIALLEITPSVKFSDLIKPACINTNPDINVTTAIISGFGKTDYYRKTGSTNLMKAVVDIIPTSTCSILDPTLISSQLCAGVLAGGKDTCQGDSGGPLQIILENPICMYNIIGVTSHGRKCGLKNAPGIYSKVSHYVPWIVHYVWPNSTTNSTDEYVLKYKTEEIVKQISSLKSLKKGLMYW